MVTYLMGDVLFCSARAREEAPPCRWLCSGSNAVGDIVRNDRGHFCARTAGSASGSARPLKEETKEGGRAFAAAFDSRDTPLMRMEQWLR